jgi:tetratricopeptide (TPR) repeat protein
MQFPRRSRTEALLVLLLLAGCTASPEKTSPSLFGSLRKDDSVQKASYEVEADIVSPSRIRDPLALKLRYARWMEELRNYPEARTHYSAILVEQPENLEAIVGLARIDHAAGRLAEAEDGFRKALAQRADSALANQAYGEFLLAQGRPAEAVSLLNRAVAADPGNQAANYHFAVALARTGDLQAAFPYFKKTVGEAAAHFNVATLLRERGDVHAAEQHFRQALLSNPQLDAARLALADLQRQRSPHYADAHAIAPAPAAAPAPVPAQSLPNSALSTTDGVRPAALYTVSQPAPSRPTHQPSGVTAAHEEQRANQRPLPR